MKLPITLLVNDLHIEKNSIPEFEKNWDEVLAVCKQHKIEEIVIGGDLWTASASQPLSVLMAAQRAMIKAKNENLVITIANGNHCKVDAESVDGYSSIFKNYSHITVVDTYMILRWEECDVTLVVMSYFPENGSFIDKLNEVKETVANFIPLSDIILYIHEGVHGALGDFEIPKELPQDIFTGFRKVLAGHYHNRTKIKGTNIEYIGASRQMNFGEDEEKGYTILYDDGSYEFVKNQVNTRYKTISLTLSQLNDQDYELSDTDKYKYRLKLKCDSADVKNINKNDLLALGFSKIEFETEKVVAADIHSTNITKKYDKNGIRAEYVSFCTDNGIDSKLGLKYL